MEQEKTPGEIKMQALKTLKGNWKNSLAVVILAFFITSSLTAYDTLLIMASDNPLAATQPSAISTMASIQSLLLTGPVSYGLAKFFLHVRGDKETEIVLLFSGFKKFLKTFLCSFIQSIFVLLWSFLLIIPGIIAAISYSQAFYLMTRHDGLGPMEAIEMSKEMMRGHKSRYFVLLLSFIGWFLLSFLTLGLVYLFLGPYYNRTMAVFHENLYKITPDHIKSKYIKEIPSE